MVERSERYASVAKPEEPQELSDERVPCLLYEVAPDAETIMLRIIYFRRSEKWIQERKGFGFTPINPPKSPAQSQKTRILLLMT